MNNHMINLSNTKHVLFRNMLDEVALCPKHLNELKNSTLLTDYLRGEHDD